MMRSQIQAYELGSEKTGETRIGIDRGFFLGGYEYGS